MSGLLDGVNVAAVGLIRFKLNPARLVLGGGLVALLYRLAAG